MAYKLTRINQTNENFADGKKPGRKGLAKRMGVNCKQSVSKLRKIAASSSGERQRMAHWCANMKSGKRKTNEAAEENNRLTTVHSAIRDFLPIAMTELDLKQLPKISIVHKMENGAQPTFGSFSGTGITLAIDNRHPVDILRTLAHELVHFKQLINGQIKDNSGETGSPEENEANSVAGIIMRNFSKQYPDYIS